VLQPVLKRASWTLLTTVAVVASLLVFPSALPWMIAAWIMLHSVFVLRGWPGWFPLVACCAIVIVKRPYWPTSLIILVGIMAVVAAFRALGTKQLPRIQRELAWSGITVLCISWTLFAIDWIATSQSRRDVAMDSSRPVICIGDSLTAFGYPDVLSTQITVPVINLGVDGLTTTDALRMIGKIQSAEPQAVIIELGGHDYLKKRSRSETATNLTTIIDACHGVDANVVIMEIPRGFITDPFSGLERELARKHDLELIPDGAIRKLILWSKYSPLGMWSDSSSHLSDDGLHPNQRGNKHLANCVASTLAKMYGEKIVKPE
jgi:acyl-CoA thioesterase-1